MNQKEQRNEAPGSVSSRNWIDRRASWLTRERPRHHREAGRVPRSLPCCQRGWLGAVRSPPLAIFLQYDQIIGVLAFEDYVPQTAWAIGASSGPTSRIFSLFTYAMVRLPATARDVRVQRCAGFQFRWAVPSVTRSTWHSHAFGRADERRRQRRSADGGKSSLGPTCSSPPFASRRCDRTSSAPLPGCG